jgi:hypothetical protein
MKIRFAVIGLFAAGVLCLAATASVHPGTLFKTDGRLVIGDGSSYYVFRTNGTFLSAPVGMSGRTFEGTCVATIESDRVSFTVHATKGWMNGPTLHDEYRIIFVVHSGGTKRAEKPYILREPKADGVYDGYFLIEELVKVAKPEK